MPYTQLTKDERFTITQMTDEGFGPAAIGLHLARDKSTVSRELSRNADRRGGYHYADAQKQADDRRQDAPRHRWTNHPPLVAYVRRGLNRKWSPEQISGRLAKTFPNDLWMRVSPEAIYQWCYREHECGRSLAKKLRYRRTRRKHRCVGERAGKRGQIPGRVDIEKRPVAVEDRRRFGDWESDTIEGAKGTGLMVTLVERKSRLVLVAKVRTKHAAAVTAAIIALIGGLPKMLRRTITADNGKEFAGFSEVDEKLGTQTYFAKPHSPWERGANENTNGLLRDFFPKGSDFRQFSNSRVASVQAMMNNRPRKCLGYCSPLEVLNRLPGVALQI